MVDGGHRGRVAAAGGVAELALLSLVRLAKLGVLQVSLRDDADVPLDAAGESTGEDHERNDDLGKHAHARCTPTSGPRAVIVMIRSIILAGSGRPVWTQAPNSWINCPMPSSLTRGARKAAIS